MLNIDDVLAAIGATEPSDFNEFCRGLKDCPAKGDTAGWREVFNILRQLEADQLVEVSRTGKTIDTMQLTEAGAARARERLDSQRGLLTMMR
jgi:hypothetical protein